MKDLYLMLMVAGISGIIWPRMGFIVLTVGMVLTVALNH